MRWRFARYQYSNNNPLKFVDPDGHEPILAKIYNWIKENEQQRELARIDHNLERAIKLSERDGRDPMQIYERLEEQDQITMQAIETAAAFSGGIKFKGLRGSRLFSGVTTRLSALLGTEGIEVTDHAARQVIERIFRGNLKGIRLENIRSAILHGEAYYDPTKNSYLLVHKGLAAVIGKGKGGKFVLKTVEPFTPQKKLQRIDRKNIGLLVCDECADSPFLGHDRRFMPEGPLLR